MSASIGLTSVQTLAKGAILVQFSDGTGIEFANQAALDAYVDEPAIDADMRSDILRRVLLAKRRKNGDAAAVGRTATFDIGQAAVIVRIS